MNAIMKTELDRVAEVAVSHGRDDPALDVFLAFVATLEPPPDAVTLKPAARRIGKKRLAQGLDRPGDSRLGACRLLTASAEAPRVVALPATPPLAPAVSALPEPVENDEDAGSGRWISELFEDLLRAIRVVVSLLT
jgi:hypothetical protein